jgi:hypothetical protein
MRFLKCTRSLLSQGSLQLNSVTPQKPGVPIALELHGYHFIAEVFQLLENQQTHHQPYRLLTN